MLRKSLILLGVVMFLLGASVSVSAVTDGTGDLFHRMEDTSDPVGWGFERYTGEKPNIDITDISYTTTDTQVTITMTVAGVIEDKEGLSYYVYMPHSTVAMGGLAYYTNSFYYVWGDTAASANSEMTSHAGTNTLTFTIDYEDPTGITDVWGYTYEVADVLQSTNGEYWGDWAPDTYFAAYDLFYGDTTTDDTTTDDTTTDDTTTDDTTTDDITTDDTTTDDTTTEDGKSPGFELIAILGAIGVALILLKRRK